MSYIGVRGRTCTQIVYLIVCIIINKYTLQYSGVSIIIILFDLNNSRVCLRYYTI